MSSAEGKTRLVDQWVHNPWRPVDYLALIASFLFVLLLLVSWLTAPTLTVHHKFFTEDGLIDAEIVVPRSFHGAFEATVRDASNLSVICPGGRHGHHYIANTTYGEPRALAWWSDGDCEMADMPFDTPFVVETVYYLPGLLWGVLPDRIVTEMTPLPFVRRSTVN